MTDGLLGDKRSTGQDIWIVITIGPDRGDGELFAVFNVTEDAEADTPPHGHRH